MAMDRLGVELAARSPRGSPRRRSAAVADPVIRATVRQNFMAVADESVALHHGASRQQVLRHVAWAMLHDIAVALDLPVEYHPEM